MVQQRIQASYRHVTAVSVIRDSRPPRLHGLIDLDYQRQRISPTRRTTCRGWPAYCFAASFTLACFAELGVQAVEHDRLSREVVAFDGVWPQTDQRVHGIGERRVCARD